MDDMVYRCTKCHEVAQFQAMHPDDDVPGHFDGSELQCLECFAVFAGNSDIAELLATNPQAVTED